MNKRIIFSVASMLILTVNAFSQVGIATTSITPNASSMLEVQSTTKGVLIPRMALTSTTVAAPVTSPATSLLIFNTATAGDVTPGFYFWDGAKWVRLLSGSFPADSWKLLGNAGTVATTHFIGTTDAIDFVTRTSNTERARILSAGNVLINRTSALVATDLFEAQGNATFPNAVNGYTDQASGIGVRGVNNAATGSGSGIGVYGLSYQTGTAGVYGSGSTYTRGVIAINDNANYAAAQAQNANAGGDVIYATNTATAGTGTGSALYASSNQYGCATIMAVLESTSYYANSSISGINNTSYEGTKPKGIAAGVASDDGYGLMAVNTASAGTATGCGVYASTEQNHGYGIEGVNLNTTGTGSMGVGNKRTGSFLNSGSGGAFTGLTVGSFDYGDSTISTGTLGVGNAQTGYTLTNGSGGAFTGSNIGVYGYAINSGNGTWGGYFDHGGSAFAYVGGQTGGTTYKINGSGSVSTIVTRPDNTKANMFCPEAPEILFQDYGSGKLVNGKAHITLDPIFTNNIYVSNEHPMRVFIQLEGDCNGVYVSNKTGTGFDVTELQGGQSDIEFSWTVVANRADALDEQGNVESKHIGVRFPDAPARQNKSATTTKKAENVNTETMTKDMSKTLIKDTVTSGKANNDTNK